MNHSWHYADQHGRQQGPVELEALQAAVDKGELRREGLVWREGWGEWRRLSDAATEIGLRLPAAPPPLPPRSSTAGAAGQRVIVAQRDNSSRILVVVILLFGFIVFGGIVAAIAIPAYHDYTLRSKIAQALSEAAPIRLLVHESYVKEQRCLFNGEDGIGEERSYASNVVDKIVVGTLSDDAARCALEITFKDKIGLPAGDPQRLLMYLDADLTWRHESNIPHKYLPASIRHQLSE